MSPHGKARVISAGAETQRKLLVLFAAASMIPVLLLLYVSVAYLFPASREGTTSLQPTALVLLLVACVALAAAGAILITTTARRLGSIASSVAAAVPPAPGVRADELGQVESAARRLKNVVERQKSEIHELRQEQSQLHQELRRLQDEVDKGQSDEAVPGTWDLDGWQEYLDQEVERSRRYHRHFCVIFLQINGFAETVGTLPSAEREEVGRGITERLRSWVRLSDLMAGTPQKYFVVLLPETDQHGGRRVAERLVARLSEGSFVTRSALQGISFAAAAGIANFPNDARDSGSLIECARAALATACAEGSGAVANYDKGQRRSGNWPPPHSP